MCHVSPWSGRELTQILLLVALVFASNTHIPTVIYTITGPHFPKHHNRSYIQRIRDDPTNLSGSDNSNAKWPATSLLGPGPEPDFDALVELVFNDWARCKRFFDMIKQEDAHRVLAADEESFMDRGKTKAVVLDEVTGNRNCAQPPLE